MSRAAAKSLRIAVFASGSGSNFQALVEAAQAGKLGGSIELLVCDRPKAKVVERAAAAGVDAFVFRPKEYASREAYEAEIVRHLREREIDLIVMAGYMRIITPTLVEPFYGRIVNIHPSLLPAFPGLNAIGQALEHGVKLTGITVHFVDGGMDTGPIIAQRPVEIADGDSVDTLADKVHPIEHELYPEVVAAICEGRVTLDGRHVRVAGKE
ncbi:phosphoribosylglycinamide formyltransferase [Paenibacillus koleovorans]|uniref:phosphoribosylglycinamide formyltransferase n=1 Tax=Paenibacillus koleovorans TaxID=121608 RepID=UPI000FD96B4C|nr:phosphoribosylglycinamide formyltransferase [Paenibacillus koleovorans]